MTAAHHVAEWGAEVALVDSAPHIGGTFLFLDHTFTTDTCGLCIALPRQPSTCPTIASQDHPRISTFTDTTLTALDGEPGRFVATLRHGARYVDPERCDNCGACAEVCPVTRPSSRWGRFLADSVDPAAGPTRQGAIYAPPPRAVPYAYAIDPGACTMCGACTDVCPRDAIDLGAAEWEEEMEVGAVMLAPGFAPFDAARAVEYGWGRCANVVTSLEFERMLNRSGPTKGRVLCPSDGRVPQRIAFIHCVGSRSEALERPYCSSSCCMITAKHVGLTKDVIPEADLTVFTMDVRTAGKGYERYFQRVADLPAVTYRRGRPAAVHELPGPRGDLRLLTPEGEEVVDLLVLAVGMGPAEGVEELAEAAGVVVGEYGFLVTGEEGPGSTSRPGVWSAGHGVAPADVPETVTEAAAAAAMIAESLAPAPDVEVEAEKELGEREGRLDQPPRVGLFLCTCRGEMDERLDFAVLAATAERLRGVEYVTCLARACEASDLKAIERAAAEHDLNRLVIAGCSPHLYVDRFEGVMARLGLPPRLLERANVREGAAWPQGDDVAAATAVAQGEIAMAVGAVRETPERPGDRVTPFGPGTREGVVERVLVLGGGLAGMTAAVTLAELGVGCDLVEREAELGGELRASFRTLEGLDAQALLRQTVGRVEANEGIRLWAEAELVAWSGTQGDFQAEIRVRDDVRAEQYGALIVATGAEAAATSDYAYGRNPSVVTQRELERQIADPAQAGAFKPRSVVMIQCVGSRNDEHPYCSRVCCGHAIKNALALKSINPAIEISVLYRDIRTMGTRELYYREARRLGVQFLRYEPPQTPVVEPQGDQLRVTVHDTLYDETSTLDADLLVLSTGIVASPDNGPLAETLGVELDEDGFFAEVHPKLRPTDLPKPGLFLCGTAYGPRFITESVGQARAAALRAALSVVRPPRVRHDIVSVEPKLCSFCGLCVTACPYGARVLDEEERVARVIDYVCQGCGACVALCPNGASRQPAFETARTLAVVDAALA
jgi:heterodisulfide reductase subunit A